MVVPGFPGESEGVRGSSSEFSGVSDGVPGGSGGFPVLQTPVGI